MLSQITMTEQPSLLEQWIKDFEAKFETVEKRRFLPEEFINDLRHKSKVLGIEELKTESGNTEIIYCYIASNNQGLILKRDDGKIGSIVSFGYISLDNFTNEHTPFSPEKKPKIIKYFLPTFLGAIIPVTYVGVKRYLEKKKESK